MGLLFRLIKPIFIMTTVLVPTVILPNIIKKAKSSGSEPPTNSISHAPMSPEPVVAHKEPRVAKAKAAPPKPKASAKPSAQKEPQYLGNARSKEIHDLNNATPSCQIKRMSDKNKVFFKTYKEAKEAIDKQGYNGCKRCFSKHHTH